MNRKLSLIWENVLEEIKLSVSTVIFQTLFTKIKLTGFENNLAVISCPNYYINDLVQKRYLPLLWSCLKHHLGPGVKIKFVIRQPNLKIKQPGPLFEVESWSKPTKEEKNHYNPQTGLHPKFTFENFVVGNANNFAYAAAQAIIKNPGYVYNPFFVWGGVGVGKTHLTQAIGHQILKNDPKMKVCYLTAETFTNDLVNAIKDKNITQFKQKYRQIDVLLIDDIQFISGKEYVQEEIFHTFNNLYIANKQVVLTSDRQPEQIPRIEERLISRFMGGLTVDIQPPDYEMRVAILKQKSEQLNLQIPPEVISFIAETIQSNIRELEGFLFQITAQAQAANKEITLKEVKNFFGIKKSTEKKKINYRRILSLVAKNFGVKTTDVCGKTRKKEIAIARHVAAYLLRKELELPLEEIGKILGNRDHTTIIHAEEKINRLFSTNQQLRHQIIQIQKDLYR